MAYSVAHFYWKTSMAFCLTHKQRKHITFLHHLHKQPAVCKMISRLLEFASQLNVGWYLTAFSPMHRLSCETQSAFPTGVTHDNSQTVCLNCLAQQRCVYFKTLSLNQSTAFNQRSLLISAMYSPILTVHTPTCIADYGAIQGKLKNMHFILAASSGPEITCYNIYSKQLFNVS